nr:hypothetical protein [Dactylosporangium vinaceum]
MRDEWIYSRPFNYGQDRADAYPDGCTPTTHHRGHTAFGSRPRISRSGRERSAG